MSANAPRREVKRFMYVNRRAPHGGIYAWESLEAVFIGAAFGQDVSVVFLDDGVFQLKTSQDPTRLGMKNFSRAYRALEMHDVEKIYVEQESLQARGLGPGDLVVPAMLVTSAELGALMAAQDVILSF